MKKGEEQVTIWYPVGAKRIRAESPRAVLDKIDKIDKIARLNGSTKLEAMQLCAEEGLRALEEEASAPCVPPPRLAVVPPPPARSVTRGRGICGPVADPPPCRVVQKPTENQGAPRNRHSRRK